MKLTLVKRGILAPLFFFTPLLLSANLIINNDDIVDQRALHKIMQMGEELRSKTGISVYLSANQTLNGKKIKEYEKEISSTLKKPYILLTFSKKETKVDILASDRAYEMFDKEQVLSPYPWSGTIIPLLSTKSKDVKAKESAALLNGYADIVEQVSKYKGIELESAIGSDNKFIYNLLKIVFYGSLGTFFLIWIYNKRKRSNE